MHVGILRFELLIHDVSSLKEKRRVVRGLIERLRGRFKVAIAEVDYADRHGAAAIGVAVVGNDPRVLEALLHRVLDAAATDREAELTTHELEILRP